MQSCALAQVSLFSFCFDSRIKNFVSLFLFYAKILLFRQSWCSLFSLVFVDISISISESKPKAKLLLFNSSSSFRQQVKIPLHCSQAGNLGHLCNERLLGQTELQSFQRNEIALWTTRTDGRCKIRFCSDKPATRRICARQPLKSPSPRRASSAKLRSSAQHSLDPLFCSSASVSRITSDAKAARVLSNPSTGFFRVGAKVLIESVTEEQVIN